MHILHRHFDTLYGAMYSMVPCTVRRRHRGTGRCSEGWLNRRPCNKDVESIVKSIHHLFTGVIPEASSPHNLRICLVPLTESRTRTTAFQLAASQINQYSITADVECVVCRCTIVQESVLHALSRRAVSRARAMQLAWDAQLKLVRYERPSHPMS